MKAPSSDLTFILYLCTSYYKASFKWENPFGGNLMPTVLLMLSHRLVVTALAFFAVSYHAGRVKSGSFRYALTSENRSESHAALLRTVPLTILPVFWLHSRSYHQNISRCCYLRLAGEFTLVYVKMRQNLTVSLNSRRLRSILLTKGIFSNPIIQ